MKTIRFMILALYTRFLLWRLRRQMRAFVTAFNKHTHP